MGIVYIAILIVVSFIVTPRSVLAGLLTETRFGVVEQAADPNVARVKPGDRVRFEVSVDSDLLIGEGSETLDLDDVSVMLSIRIGVLTFDEEGLLSFGAAASGGDGAVFGDPFTRGMLFFEDGTLVGADLLIAANGGPPLLGGPQLRISGVDGSFCLVALFGGCAPSFPDSQAVMGRIRFEVPEPGSLLLSFGAAVALLVRWRARASRA